jgi:hypothetical protein
MLSSSFSGSLVIMPIVVVALGWLGTWLVLRFTP